MAPKSSTTMRGLIISIPAFAHLAQAATQIVMMVNPLGSDVPLVASIIAAAPSATTYAMACGPNFPPRVADLPSSQICPSLAAITITQGPSTIAYTALENWATAPSAPSTNVKSALHCNLQGTTAAICTNSFEGLEKIVLPTQGLSPAEISMGQASLDALKVAETITLTGSDFPAFGNVVVTAGVEKLGQVSAASAASAGSGSATGGKQASFTATMADLPTGSGVIGNPGINSISATTNPVGGGAVTGVAKTSAGAAAAATTLGTAKSANTSTAKSAAATTGKSSASGLSIANGCTMLAGALAVVLFL